MDREESTVESLDQEANRAIEEARMVLPGIQALFGFQLIAVFNTRFSELMPEEQRLHLFAIVLVVVSILLIMAPAAYHRQAERGLVSRYFVDLASRLLTWALAPLLLALVLEVFLVSKIVLQSTPTSAAIGAGLLVIFAWLWFVFPHLRARRRALRRK